MKAGAKITTKQKIDLQDRRDQVMALARAGMKQRDIAKRLNMSLGTVNRDIRIRIREHVRDHEDTDAVRAMTIARFESFLVKWTTPAANDPVALQRVITLIEKIAQYSGVAPKQSMDITSDGKPLTAGPITVQLMRPDGTIEDITPSGSSPEVTVDTPGIGSEG